MTKRCDDEWENAKYSVAYVVAHCIAYVTTMHVECENERQETWGSLESIFCEEFS